MSTHKVDGIALTGEYAIVLASSYGSDVRKKLTAVISISQEMSYGTHFAVAINGCSYRTEELAAVVRVYNSEKIPEALAL